MVKKTFQKSINFYIYILIILGFLVVVNYVGSKVFARLDLTKNKLYSISNSSKRIMNKLEDLVTIKIYISDKILPSLAVGRANRIKDLLAEYKAYSNGNLNVEIYDPTDNPDVQSNARREGIQEVTMQTIEKDRQQNVMVYMGISILFEDKMEVIPVVQNVDNLEYDITSRIIKLTRKEIKKVAFYFGDGPLSYVPKQVRQQMQRQQQEPNLYNNVKDGLDELFNVSIVTGLNEGKTIDSDIVTLIVAGPKTLSEMEKFEIDQFVMRGGNLVLLLDAIEVNTERGLEASIKPWDLDTFLKPFGVKLDKNIIADARHGQMTYYMNYGKFNLPVQTPYAFWPISSNKEFDAKNPVMAGLNQIMFRWPSSVTVLPTVNAITVESMLKTTKLSQAISTDPLNLNPQQKFNFKNGSGMERNYAVKSNGKFSSSFSSLPMGVDLSRKLFTTSVKNATVITIGDSDFLSDGNSVENVKFMLNLVEWLTLGDYLIGIRAKTQTMNFIKSDLTEPSKNIIRILNIFLIPFIFVVIGLVVRFKKKKRSGKAGK